VFIFYWSSYRKNSVENFHQHRKRSPSSSHSINGRGKGQRERGRKMGYWGIFFSCVLASFPLPRLRLLRRISPHNVLHNIAHILCPQHCAQYCPQHWSQHRAQQSSSVCLFLIFYYHSTSDLDDLDFSNVIKVPYTVLQILRASEQIFQRKDNWLVSLLTYLVIEAILYFCCCKKKQVLETVTFFF